MKNTIPITILFFLCSICFFGQNISHVDKGVKIDFYWSKHNNDSLIVATMKITNISNKKVIITARNPNSHRSKSNVLWMDLYYSLPELHKMGNMSIPIYYLYPEESIIVSKIKKSITKDLKEIVIYFNVLDISKFDKKKCTKNINTTNDFLNVDCYTTYIEKNGLSTFFYRYDIGKK